MIVSERYNFRAAQFVS